MITLEEGIYSGTATPGSGGGGGSEGINFYIPFQNDCVPESDYSFSADYNKELPDLEYELYTGHFSFEQDEQDETLFRFVGGAVEKGGEEVGVAEPYLIIYRYDSPLSNPIRVNEMTQTSENAWDIDLGDYTTSLSYEVSGETSGLVGGAVIDKATEQEIGDCQFYWTIKLNPPAPVQKGSFDSTTQQLTLNYDYLVEMINSSEATTDEQKSTMIALLNNQSPVIDMTTDTAEENQYLYAFLSTDEMIPVGLQVDKTTPCSLRLAFTGESVAGFGSWQAMADYMSMSGETVTAEMVEAMYGAFIVDDNFCTVSGTLGNFSVEFN